MDKLRDRYKQLLTPIQQGLSSLNRPRRNISNNSGLVQQAYRSKVGQQVAQVRLPGSGRTLEQGVRHNIQNANLVKNLASGRYFSGSVPQAKSLDRYIAQPTGQALNVVGEGLTATLANFGVKKAETLPERIGHGVGVVAAIPALLATGGGATGQVSKYAEMLVRPAATTGRLSRIAPAIAGELAQTGSLLAGKKALGQEFDPKTDLLFGLGGRGAFGALGTLSRVPSDAGMDEIIKRGKALGIKGISPRANNIHAEDYDFMHQFNDRVTALPKGATMTDRDPFLKQAQELAGHYFGKQWAKADSKTLKKLFDWGIDLTDHLPRDQRAQLPDLPGSKFVNNLIGDDVVEAAGLAEKKAGNINLERMNIDPKAKANLTQEVAKAKEEIKEVVGKRLTNEEVIESAKESDVLRRVVTREDTQAFEAQLLKLRQAVAAGAEGKGVTQEFLDSLKVLSSQAADTGRRLQSFSINADPALDSTKARMIARLQKLGVQSEDILKRAEGVDFNDNRQAVEFYRSFVKPSIGEILEEYRYMNLLSSPRTHIVNVFSNALQTGVTRPATKLAAAAIDPVVAALQGRKREVYLKEVPAYYRGMFGSIPQAFQRVQDVFSGKQQFTNLDMNHIPTGSLLSKGNLVTKSLEGMDQFFQTLVRGGETASLRSRGSLSDEEILKRATDMGEYTVFRQGLKPEGQGPVLNWVDQGTQAVMELRRVPGMGWFIPFIQTPMNIFKQGIEYSPMGAATAIGAKDKTEQLAKAAVGSMVFTGAGYLALQDRLTWQAPKDPVQKKAFYAAGMQPYAAKVGDKWISFSKLGPLAYPLALASAIKYSFEDNPEAVASGNLEKLGDSLAGIMGFFGDQSYMQGIGDLVNAIQGQEGYRSTFATAAGNIATQYIPLSSFQRWVNNIIDPIYRKGENVGDNIQKSIVFRSDNVSGVYEDPYGEPSRRQFPGLNAFSPMSVTKEDPEFMEMYDLRQEKLEGNALIRKMKEEVEQEKEVKANRAEASEEFSQGETGADDPKELQRIKIKQEIARESVRLKGGVQEAGGVAYYTNDEGGVSSLNLGKFSKPATGIKALELEGEKQSTARKIVAEDAFDDKRKDRYLKALGITREDAEYDYYATRENDVKSQLMASTLANMGREQMFTTLVEGRKQSLSGKRYVSDGVIDDLVDEGLLTYAEGKALKKVKPETGATTTGAASTSKGGGKKGKTNRDITIPKGSRSISSGKVKVKQVRSQAPKLKRVTLRSKGSSVPRVTPVKKKRSAAAAIRATQLRS